MKVKFGDKLLNTTEAFEDGLYMLMEEIIEMVVSQYPEADENFNYGWAWVGNFDKPDSEGDRHLSIDLWLSPNIQAVADTFEIYTDEEYYNGEYIS